MHNAKERFKLIPAIFIFFRKNDKVLLLQRANTGYQDGKYSVVAGHIDGDELATAAAVREAKEEAGVTVNPKDLKLVHTAHRLAREQVGQERLDLFFEVWQWDGEPSNTEPNKCSDLSWYPIEELPDNTIPYVRNVIHDISQGITFSEYTDEPV